MKRRALHLAASLLLALILGAGAASTASAAVGDELLANPGVEVPDSAGTGPAFWSASTWGNPGTTPSQVSFDWPADAHAGGHSVRVEVTTYTDGGDSKWVSDVIDVEGGGYYTFSDWYKSDVNTAVSVYYETASGGKWANLFSGIAPASTWTQYQTGFTMPDGAIRAQFVHFIAAPGYLQTDDYSVRQAAAPPGFSSPMVSLTFDDGSRGFYDDALPLLDEKRFKTTQYIPTYGLTTSPPDSFMMTKQQIGALVAAGHEIASHTITHPDLTAVPADQLTTELKVSKTLLESIPGTGTIRSVAYPFGTYDARVIAAAADAGYRSGRSVEEGYNAKPDLEPFDLRVQNVLSTTTLDEFESWVDYAKAHKYWLVLVYHEVMPDGALLGDYDTTVSRFKAQLDYIAAQGVDVKTVQAALATALDSGSPTPTPTPAQTPAPSPTPTPMPSPSATPPPSATSALSSDRLVPRIVVKSPRARAYKVGQMLRISFSCTDSSGIATSKATLRRIGGKARALKKGQHVRLTRTGTYVLRVTARDRAGNSTSRTVRFRVTRT